MDRTPQQRLDEAERVRRHLQRTVAENSGVPAMTRDEYLKLYDENFGQLIEIAKRLGVAEGEAPAVARHARDLLAALPAGSDFDDPCILFILHELESDIKAAFRYLPLSMRNGVILGATHVTRPDAQLYAVYPNDTSIVEVAIPTFSFCNHIAQAMAHTIPQGVEAARLKFEKYRADGTAPAENWVRRRWASIFLAYATVEAPRFEPDQNRPPYWKTHPILDAMELFMVGHEFGHHAAQGCELTKEPMAEEHYADFIARNLSLAVAKLRNTPLDFFLISGAGAPLLLGSLDMLLRARQVLTDGTDALPPSETHPPVRERLQALDAAEPLFFIPGLEEIQGPDGAEAPRFINFRRSLSFILDTIWLSLRPRFEQLHRDGIRPTPEPSDYITRLLRSG